jgi:membrane fusion protein, heavy metal efflux system
MNRTSLWAGVGLAAAIAISGCSKNQSVVEASTVPPAVQVETVQDSNVISVQRPERFSLVTATARAMIGQLGANGVVAPDVSRTVPVLALSSGRVQDVRVRLGDDVQQGQLLLTFSSPDMSQAISDYKKFQTDEKLAKTQYERAQLLFSHGALAQKDLEIAEDAYAKAKVDTQAAAERIRILGGDPQNPSTLIEVRAPVSGTVIEQNVTTAAGVRSLDNSPNLFTIANLSSVWVVCDVYENDLSRVHMDDRAEITLNAYPNRRFQGRVTNISKLLDPATRTAKIRIELPNESGILRPNMFATVSFLTQGSQMATVIPSSAILRLRDRDWVFIKVGDGKFRRTEVQAGPVNTDGTQQVLSGLRAGDSVVSEALLFDRESQNQQ